MARCAAERQEPVIAGDCLGRMPRWHSRAKQGTAGPNKAQPGRSKQAARLRNQANGL
jgi:hypothetical protein